jgi:hypothetical protein
MTQQKKNLRTITINNKGYGDLDGSEFFITEALHEELRSRKSGTGQGFLQLLESGKAVRGFKHLLEHIRDKSENARIILTNGKTRKAGNHYYINLNEYSNKGYGKFRSFYRETALRISSAYLSEQFPRDFPSSDESLSSEDLKKASKNLDYVLDELTQKKKHKKQILRKTSLMVKDLRQEEKELRQNIDELEELRRESSIAFYIERLAELKSRFSKNFRETKGKDSWQSWIYRNNWIMGIQYLPPIDKQRVGFDNIPDYLFPTLDGFIDVLEIKLPSHEVIKPDSSHPGSYAWSSEANKAIGQVVNYLYEMELNQLVLQNKINRKYAKRLDREIKIIKPRAFILIGAEDNWDAETKEAFRKLNHTLHGIEVITYTEIVKRGEYIVNLYSKK